MTIERKTIDAEIKLAGEDGSFEAVVATFGVIDHDGDIIEHGAFSGHPIAVLPAHDQQHVPLGKARIVERGDLAIAVGQFNLEIQAAKDWSSSLKFDLANPPAVGEWSWGFRILGPDGARSDTVDGEPVRRLLKLDEREVSPVLRGASIGTGTLSAKSDYPPVSLVEQIKAATGEVGKLIEAIQSVADRRKEKGRALGPDIRLATVQMAKETSKLLDQLTKAMQAEIVEIAEKNSDPEECERRREAAKATALYLAMNARRAGVEL